LIVLSVDDSVDVCSFAVLSVVSVAVPAEVPLPGVEVEVVVDLLDVRRDDASGRREEPAPEAVDDATDRLADDVPAVSSAAEDGAVDFGPRAVWPVAFFADAELEDPEFDVAEFAGPVEELWSVSSALATATTGPASDNPRTKAATPALAPR
jgi:hypothetical protein